MTWQTRTTVCGPAAVASAKLQDASRSIIFGTVLVGACGSLFAVAYLLGTAKNQAGSGAYRWSTRCSRFYSTRWYLRSPSIWRLGSCPRRRLRNRPRTRRRPRPRNGWHVDEAYLLLSRRWAMARGLNATPIEDEDDDEYEDEEGASVTLKKICLDQVPKPD